MTTDTVAIQVPQAVYRRLERLAQLTRRPLESLIVQALSSNLPPLPDDLPAAQRDALVALEGLSDDELWAVTRSAMPQRDQERFAALRDQRLAGTLDPAEEAALDQFAQAADLLTLRKAYAAVLLRWRGHQLPTPDELAARP